MNSDNTFLDCECGLALINCFLCAFQHLLRGFKKFSKLVVWRQKRFSIKISDDCAVKQGLLYAVESRVIRQTSIKPRESVPG